MFLPFQLLASCELQFELFPSDMIYWCNFIQYKLNFNPLYFSLNKNPRIKLSGLNFYSKFNKLVTWFRARAWKWKVVSIGDISSDFIPLSENAHVLSPLGKLESLQCKKSEGSSNQLSSLYGDITHGDPLRSRAGFVQRELMEVTVKREQNVLKHEI